MNQASNRSMRILFLHQNFPGQFKLLAAHLAAQPGYEVMGLGEAANLERRGLKFPFRFSATRRGLPARRRPITI
jgi:hypothetical protein